MYTARHCRRKEAGILLCKVDRARLVDPARRGRCLALMEADGSRSLSTSWHKFATFLPEPPCWLAVPGRRVKSGIAGIQRAVTQVGLPADPLGRDTRDFLTCAVGVADASLNGTARVAAIEEIGRVEAAGTGGAKILIPDLTPLRLLGLAGSEILDLLFLTGADVWLVDSVRDESGNPDPGPEVVQECGAILNSWFRRNGRGIRIQETERGIENRKALKTWMMAGRPLNLSRTHGVIPCSRWRMICTSPSPCVVRCSLSEDRLHCPECLRTLDEIRCWWHMPSKQKRAVLARMESITGQKFVLIAKGRVARWSGVGEGVDPLQLIDAVRKVTVSGNAVIVLTDNRTSGPSCATLTCGAGRLSNLWPRRAWSDGWLSVSRPPPRRHLEAHQAITWML